MHSQVNVGKNSDKRKTLFMWPFDEDSSFKKKKKGLAPSPFHHGFEGRIWFTMCTQMQWSWSLIVVGVLFWNIWSWF